MRSMYEIERTLNECQSYISQMSIDQKSMPPCEKKKQLKVRLTDYSGKFYTLEEKFKRLQLNFKSGIEMAD